MDKLTEKQSVNVYVGKASHFAQNENLPDFVLSDLKKIRNVRVRNEKKAGYGLLAFAIEKMGIDADVRDCFLSKTGKPLHNSFEFSISHSNGIVALAISLTDSVGIDVEPLNKAKRTEKLLKKMMCDGEETISSLVLWTKKEAIFKFDGKERVFKPKTINTFDYNTKSVEIRFEEEFILSLAGKKELDAVFFSAPDGEEIVFSEILKNV